jgi:hypothetical protein
MSWRQGTYPVTCCKRCGARGGYFGRKFGPLCRPCWEAIKASTLFVEVNP